MASTYYGYARALVREDDVVPTRAVGCRCSLTVSSRLDLNYLSWISSSGCKPVGRPVRRRMRCKTEPHVR